MCASSLPTYGKVYTLSVLLVPVLLTTILSGTSLPLAVTATPLAVIKENSV